MFADYIKGHPERSLEVLVKHMTGLDNDDRIGDVAQFLQHSRSFLWQKVTLYLKRPPSESLSSYHRSLLPEDVRTQWRPVDEALAHPNYRNLTKLAIVNELDLEMLPPGYECILDVFSDLLPRQKDRLMMPPLDCDPRSADDDVLCVYHR